MTRHLTGLIAVAAMALAIVVPSVLLRSARTTGAAGITLQQIASGLSMPTDIKNAGDARLFITEQPGLIRIYDGSSLLGTPFLDVSSLVSCCTERGLLGLAFHPNYASNGLFYIYYTDTAGNIQIARYHVSADPNIADANSRTPVLTIAHPGQANHNGGGMQFGPDGMLYIGVGDGGGGGDPNNNAQNLGELLGKMLRIDVNVAPPNSGPYVIPPNNPFVNTPGARGEIWAYGLRNPWRFSLDRATGDLIIGDVGQNAWEEVDFQPAGGAGGQDYGWRLMEGTHCYNPATNCDSGGLTMPILEYSHVNGDCSITGGYRYRGSTVAAQGIYLYGDYCSGHIWGATQNGPTWSSSLLLDASMNVSTFGQGSDGELYVAGYGGTISRIVLQADTDGDGCIDVRESGADHRLGGQRDATSGWDFFDVPAPSLLPSNASGTRNRVISIGDTIALLAYIGTSSANPTTPNAQGAMYGSDLDANGVQDGQQYDRTMGAQPWAPAGPNGAVTISDALVSINSIGDNCG